MRSAIQVIKDEHRSLAVVLHGLKFLLRQIGERRIEPDFTLIRAMLDYLDQFPARLHHPKEDAYLFRMLRNRTREADDVLEDLEIEHAQEARRIGELYDALERWEQGVDNAFELFAYRAESYAAFHWQHMRKEEDIVLPLAERHLTGEDWRRIDAAFSDNRDPLFGCDTEQELRELFSRIVKLAPTPAGTGLAANSDQL